MPWLILALVIAVVAWQAGWVKRWSWREGMAVAVMLIGGRAIMGGEALPGLLMIAAASVWWTWKRPSDLRARELDEPQPGAAGMSAGEACAVLGIGPDPSRDTVIAAHRRLIARTHPDQGGSAALAARVNQARDVLLSISGDNHAP